MTEIAKELGYSRQTIYNEVNRGQCEQINSDLTKKIVYLADYAQKDCDEQSQKRGVKKKLSPDSPYIIQIKDYILNKKYSPYAATVACGGEVCEKTLYNYIYSGYIDGLTINNLPYAKPKKKHKHKTGKRLRHEGKTIEDRPKEIESREDYGNWEIDTVYSSKDDLHCLLTLTERMTREEIIIRMKDRTADSVIKALNSLERKLGTPAFWEKFKTITADNGVEFSDWQRMEQSCRTKGRRTTVYFCHPYSSYERGSNENHNKMIRRWIPKGDDIGLYTPAEVQEIEDWINNYPRKLFGGSSTREYKEACQSVQEISAENLPA